MINNQTVFLVVDDFEPMRIVTSGQLRAMGAKTILAAENGAEALRILKNNRVDIVLSDWNMPLMSGIELLKSVRADVALTHLPFIMITAEAERYRIEQAIASGVSDLLVKPYTAERLASRIEKALISRSRSGSPVRVPTAAVRSEGSAPAISAGQAVTVEPGMRVMKEGLRPTILVVDDTEESLLLLSELFKDEYRVRIAQTGQKALEICQSNTPPDLVLLDIMMPGMDGFEVAQRMREHPTSETIPVIFVTAMCGKDSRLKCLGLGAVDFVAKPIEPDELKLRVRNFMRYVELRKQLQVNCDSMLELAHLHEDVELITRHDMKGPLAGMIGLVQALKDDGSMNVRQIGQLQMVEETALQVLDIINLSSELYKIETGRFILDAKQVNISDILRRIVEISRTTFAEKHLIVAVDTDMPVGEDVPMALGDSMFCYSLCQNLIRNACEAAPVKGRVDVTLIDEIPLRIVIRNKGTVPAEIRGQFFEKFITYGKVGGSGLGTYSAKALTEAQNGTISMEVSDQENQTTITVTLPRYSGAAIL